MSVFYQCRFCGICFSFQRYFCHGRIVSNSLRRFGIGSVSQVRIQKEEILSPRIFEKKIHESARVERWRRAKERSDWAKSTTKGRENAREHTHKSIWERGARGTKWLKPWAQREALASTREQAEGWRLRHGMRGKRNAIRHDSRITSFISGWFCYNSTF